MSEECDSKIILKWILSLINFLNESWAKLYSKSFRKWMKTTLFKLFKNQR